MINTLLQFFKKHPLTKWSLLVLANTGVSLVLAQKFMKHPQGFLGVIAGILTFIFIYYTFEKYLIRVRSKQWHSAFIIAVIVTALALIEPNVPMITGFISIDTTSIIFKTIGFDQPSRSPVLFPFIATYLTTIIDGTLLSFIIVIFTFIIRGIIFLKDIKKAAKIN